MTANGMESQVRDALVLGMGNPLLDIIAFGNQEFLDKYGMKPNNAILAEDKHLPMYDEMIEKFKVEYVAGGACQNTLRLAQWILGTPKVCVLMGCIGKDSFGSILEQKASEAGVNTRYMYHEKEPTGTCAVVVTDHNRSLCANLAAANCFKIAHVKKEENWSFVESASYYYLTSFFLTVSPDSMLEVVRHACARDKTVLLNLSAPFLVQYFREPMMQVMPYVDVLFGNEDEAAVFAKEHAFGTENLQEIALKLTTLEKVNKSRSRMVVITQGPDNVIVASDGKVTEYEVPTLSSERIADTNGAGDAFTGGFLAMFIQKKSIDVCVRCGIYAASEVIQQSGCTHPKIADFSEIN